jgi:hypothetical protein
LRDFCKSGVIGKRRKQRETHSSTNFVLARVGTVRRRWFSSHVKTLKS